MLGARPPRTRSPWGERFPFSRGTARTNPSLRVSRRRRPALSFPVPQKSSVPLCGEGVALPAKGQDCGEPGRGESGGPGSRRRQRPARRGARTAAGEVFPGFFPLRAAKPTLRVPRETRLRALRALATAREPDLPGLCTLWAWRPRRAGAAQGSPVRCPTPSSGALPGPTGFLPEAAGQRDPSAFPSPGRPRRAPAALRRGRPWSPLRPAEPRRLQEAWARGSSGHLLFSDGLGLGLNERMCLRDWAQNRSGLSILGYCRNPYFFRRKTL